MEIFGLYYVTTYICYSKSNSNIHNNMSNKNTINILEDSYQQKKGRDRIEFRKKVCMKCDWATDVTFYRKRTGMVRLTTLEIEAIKKIIKES